jgi:hypothetical protein
MGREGGQQVDDGFSRHRMPPIGHQVGQRHQNESTFGHAGMRQSGLSNRLRCDLSAMVDEVEIDQAGGIGFAPAATQFGFDQMQFI